ncbi:hypothetical protein [Planomicrobium sp. CPCC 101079]|uniref:hypothetical protein n=1 Tax=Planomicrobium sp. CPCC 101079 TaxID=2599618 RepID=UPI0011B6CC0D|nr:hypothetical protein [Planomicrobium sp. CPCC 101079]TWT09298.1 hypothetical protein FQV28_06595 [Planomicrobium sp. CPCC 101079]
MKKILSISTGSLYEETCFFTTALFFVFMNAATLDVTATSRSGNGNPFLFPLLFIHPFVLFLDDWFRGSHHLLKTSDVQAKVMGYFKE